MKTIMDTFEPFIKDITHIQQQYQTSNDINKLQADLYSFTDKYKAFHGIGDYMINLGEQYIDNGNYEAGILFIKTANERVSYIYNDVTLYLRMAEYYFINQETEKGTDYLIRLCTETTSNYEESIEFRELTAVWDKYKHLVEGKVPASIPINNVPKPLPPEKCSMSITDIFALPDEDILTELSTHLAELSSNGEYLNYLNKWEKIVFYADELCMEVNSGGFNSYLYYHGKHFEKARQAFETICATQMLSLTDTIINKFPRKKVPKSMNAIQNAMDTMEEKGVDFETEDTFYYETAEKELLEKLLSYVLQNKEHFR